MLDPNKATEIRHYSYNSIRNGQKRKQRVFIYSCQCGKELRVQKQYLKKHSGQCISCSQFGEPFAAAYNELVKSSKRRSLNNKLTYHDFLNFTKISQCYYCNTNIDWQLYTKNNGKEIRNSRSYKLDRKNNKLGYSVKNCVVCCWKCNAAKSNRYMYKEWFGMTEYLRKLK